MRVSIILLFAFLYSCIFSVSAQPALDLYKDTQVAAIYLTLPPDSLQVMLDELIKDRYIPAFFVYESSTRRDTVPMVGLRLRGNTSLYAAKKSFKISFNAFVDGQTYQEVRKINLRGQHNDPSLIREKLFFEAAAKIGLPTPRASFVKLYINNVYRGLYTNLEEIDKAWLDRTFGDNDGNLYKCTYPADLAYLGTDQAAYKEIYNNPNLAVRAYDLMTNEIADDYTRFVEFILALNQPASNPNYTTQLGNRLNVDNVLKAFALDIAAGNWDDYFYNKNNYYLYDNPQNGKFEFFTFDTDNTFGIDWLGEDWHDRNALNWLPTSDQSRPLATQLLAVPTWKQKFVHYLDTISRYILHLDTVSPRLNTMHSLIADAAQSDVFRTYDYGYTINDFYNSLDMAANDGHTDYGIRPFLTLRNANTIAQIANLITTVNAPTPSFSANHATLYPNPSSGSEVWLRPPPSHKQGTLFLYDPAGKLTLEQTIFSNATTSDIALKTTNLSSGVYAAHWQPQSEAAQYIGKLVIVR